MSPRPTGPHRVPQAWGVGVLPPPGIPLCCPRHHRPARALSAPFPRIRAFPPCWPPLTSLEATLPDHVPPRPPEAAAAWPDPGQGVTHDRKGHRSGQRPGSLWSILSSTFQAASSMPLSVQAGHRDGGRNAGVRPCRETGLELLARSRSRDSPGERLLSAGRAAGRDSPGCRCQSSAGSPRGISSFPGMRRAGWAPGQTRFHPRLCVGSFFPTGVEMDVC